MQPMQQLPIFSDVADYYAYPVLTNGQQNYIQIGTAGGTAVGYTTLANDNYFVHMAYACQTNYDNAAGLFATTTSTVILAAPGNVPNAFSVSVQRQGSIIYQNTPLTQAELCSSGQLSGKQMPLPVIYSPTTTFDFNFTDLTGLFLVDGSAAPIPLRIRLWMVGYNIRKDNWERFLNYYPGLAAVY